MVDPRKLGDTFSVTLRDGEDGYIVAECPAIPGCFSQGKTRDEALANVVDAIDVCLEVIWEDWYAAQGDEDTDLGPNGDQVKLTVVPPAVLRRAS